MGLVAILLSCASGQAGPGDERAPIPPVGPGQAEAVFAGGCFWCLESDFDKLPGVVSTTSGFAGCAVADPTYEMVVRHGTGCAEAVRVVWDTTKLGYEAVLDWFWHHVDPTDAGGQFCDRGDSYRTAIFPLDAVQRATAEKSMSAIAGKLGVPVAGGERAGGQGPPLAQVATKIEDRVTFYAAEVYHQDFHDRNPSRYEPYRLGCRRDARVSEVWGRATK